MTSSKISFHIRIPADQVEEAQTALENLGQRFDPWRDMVPTCLTGSMWMWSTEIAEGIERTNRNLETKKIRPLIPENYDTWSLEQTWALMEIVNGWNEMAFDEAMPNEATHCPDDLIQWWKESMRRWRLQFNREVEPQAHCPNPEKPKTLLKLYQEQKPEKVRPIRNEKDYERALERIDRIYMAWPGAELGDERDALEDLVELYELRNHSAVSEEEYEPSAKPGNHPVRGERDYRDALKRIRQIGQAETGTELGEEREVLLDLVELYELKHPRMPKTRKAQTGQKPRMPKTRKAQAAQKP